MTVSEQSSANSALFSSGLHLSYIICTIYLVAACLLAFLSGSHSHWPLMMAATLAATYLALNLGANDAANHIGILVGARVLPVGSALLLAAAGELSGAYLASAPVSQRLREGLFHAGAIGQEMSLALVLLAGLVSAGLWLHFSTWRRIPISTTHSIVGGVVGAGLMAGGWSAPQWESLSAVALIWLVAPVCAVALAALVLYLFEHSILNRPNVLGAAKAQMPLMVALLALLLGYYLFSKLTPRQLAFADSPLLGGLATALVGFLITQPIVHYKAQSTTNNRRGVNALFGFPLIVASVFFAFAHGANDVANVAAPLTAISHIAAKGSSPESFALPNWVLLLGGLGMSLGLLMFGHRVTRTMGMDLTELDRIRGFSIVFSASLIITAASFFGYPVSSTHILVGSLIGVGLLREQLALREQVTTELIRKCHAGQDDETLKRFLKDLRGATPGRREKMLQKLFAEHCEVQLSKTELKQLRKGFSRPLVRRNLARRIVAFWILTLPVCALIGTVNYLLLNHLMT